MFKKLNAQVPIKYYYTYLLRAHVSILPPSQNINEIWSIKMDVFGVKFSPDTLIFVDLFLLIF
jgi:hypothetical protein